MPNPVAVIGLTWDGVDVQEAGFGIFLEIYRGLSEPPSVRGKDTIVPGRPGRIRRNRMVDVLTIELRGLVTGAGDDDEEQREDFARLRQIVRTLFWPADPDKVLIATLEDGSVATISAGATDRTLWDPLIPQMQRISIELESVDPDWVITPPVGS